MTRISLVIPAFNAHDTLPALLDSIEAQTLSTDQFETILVDDGSTDSSVELVRQYPRVQLLIQKNRGPGAARNHGTRVARGQIIAYTDADCILPPQWLEEDLRLHEQYPDTDAFCGGVAPALQLPYGSAVLADHLCSWFDGHDRTPERFPEHLPGANMSVKRRVFDAGIRWSEERITGEDVDLSQKLMVRGMGIRFFPKHCVRHVDRATLRGFLRHQYNWGFHAPFVRGRNRNTRYSFLFPSSVVRAWIHSPIIVFGYTWLVIQGWWRSRPLGLLSVLPLVVLGKLSYVRGVLHGTRALVSGMNGMIADRRVGARAYGGSA